MSKLIDFNPNNEDDLKKFLLAMANGHGESLQVLKLLLEKGGWVDRDTSDSGLLSVLLLDKYGVYGKSIYNLFKLSKFSIENIMVLIRATQLNLLSPDAFKFIVKCLGNDIQPVVDIKILRQQVKEKLPNFFKIESVYL